MSLAAIKLAVESVLNGFQLMLASAACEERWSGNKLTKNAAFGGFRLNFDDEFVHFKTIFKAFFNLCAYQLTPRRPLGEKKTNKKVEKNKLIKIIFP